ncbi:hypothetical protein [Sphingomonas pseudosanguinis]|uniref:Uncharacterized protein n=1 Tax=Sphingomonas pseudosanguinis TaxID=413712 RepID=A0A7W6F3A4_9SPHN|nr:hypothetical protein [Sphingomonas pseudosanguinis]MBB3879583.1 hypothetical protein [Sphingomonas pseudosanguinis]MBN3538323.1 hypothetical protein [Sphingomonas pseudosanguinis]
MRVRIELFYIVLGLVAAVIMTRAAAWAYPLARAEIWWCGAAAMVATVVMGIGPLHRARIADRMARRHSEQ